MGYQVTARKYRPQTFAQLIGQDHIRVTLQNSLSRGQVAHAYLFSGPRGVGKTTVARLLAKSVNCETRTQMVNKGEGLPGEPCNECSSCQEITEDRHPDVIEIDGASNTGVENVRDLRAQAQYTPARGRNKVYIIDEIHMLSKGAFNALLKILEEPPDNIIFIFATTEPEKIPATINSRCQSFDFHRLSPNAIIDQLQRVATGENITADAAAFHLLSRTAEGSMRDAQSLFDQVVAYAGGGEDGTSLTEGKVSEVLGLVSGSVIRKIALMIAEDDPESIVNTVRTIFSEGQDVRQFCASLMNFFRDLLVVESVRNPKSLLDMTEEEIRELPGLAKKFGQEKLHRCFRKSMEMEREVRIASNPQPVLEVALLRMGAIRPSASLQAVMEKLNAVSETLETGVTPPSLDLGGEVGGRGKDENPDLPEPPPSSKVDNLKSPPESDAPVPTSKLPESPSSAEQDGQGLWNNLMQEFEAQALPVLRYFDGGRLVSVTEGEVVLGLVGYNLNLALDHQVVIQETVSQVLGKGRKVTLLPIEQSDPQGGGLKTNDTAEAKDKNGGPPTGSDMESADPLKHMSRVLRDADEIFGDAGGSDDSPVS